MCVLLFQAVRKWLTGAVKFVTGEKPPSKEEDILKKAISSLMFKKTRTRRSKPVSVVFDRTRFADIISAFYVYENTVSVKKY
jgi:hypothetical protein